MSVPYQARTKRFAIFVTLLSVGCAGISYLHYREMVRPIPEFQSLEQITADGLQYTLSRSPRGVQYAFEFTDRKGKRFQTESMDLEEAKVIEDAVRRGGVTLWVGRWKAALKSDSIFTIHHMTTGDRVLIDYADRAAAKMKEQQGAVPIVIVSFLTVAAVVVFAYRWGVRYQH